MDAEPVLLTQPREGVPEVIDTAAGYERACERLAAATGPLAADAERASGYRYGHEDRLIQFKREDAGIILLDPIALSGRGVDWGLFNEAVGDAVWILHDSRQDLPGFADLGLRPGRLFDTEIAARMLGLHRYGLAYVTEHYLGIALAKEHSAADWSYRPLSRDLRNYAALDVELLIELDEAMTRDLKRQGKLAWAEEEFAHALMAGLEPRRQHPTPWMRVSHITDLGGDTRALAVVKALWERRDELARHYDIAPTLLLSDAAIIEAAKRKPHNAAQFRAIRSLNERVRIQLGTEQDKMFERYAPIQRQIKPRVWKETIQQALDLPDAQLPQAVRQQGGAEAGNAPKSMRIWRQHHPQRYRLLQECRAVVNQIAEDVRIPPDMVLKPQILRNLCWTDHPKRRDVADFLRAEGARAWQIGLLNASLTRVIM